MGGGTGGTGSGATSRAASAAGDGRSWRAPQAAAQEEPAAAATAAAPGSSTCHPKGPGAWLRQDGPKAPQRALLCAASVPCAASSLQRHASTHGTSPSATRALSRTSPRWPLLRLPLAAALLLLLLLGASDRGAAAAAAAAGADAGGGGASQRLRGGLGRSLLQGALRGQGGQLAAAQAAGVAAQAAGVAAQAAGAAAQVAGFAAQAAGVAARVAGVNSAVAAVAATTGGAEAVAAAGTGGGGAAGGAADADADADAEDDVGGAAVNSGINYEAPGDPMELVRCINENQPTHNGTSWRAAMRDAPSYFQVIGHWWSSKPSNVPLTVTTQLSWNRKWQLKAMCRSWAGPVAAVMHVPVLLPRLTRRHEGLLEHLTNRTLQRALDKVASFHSKMESQQPCKLDLLLLAEPYRDGKSLLLYPVNALRNYARLMARTPLVVQADVDLVLSRSLHRHLSKPDVAASYVADADAAVAAAAAGRRGAAYSTGRSRVSGADDLAASLGVSVPPRNASAPRAAYVLPAFVTRGGTVQQQVARADKLVGASKRQLHEFFHRKQIARFDPAASGHKATDYTAWFAATAPYTVQWNARYEPWVITDRLSAPWADARFRGYGKNKIIFARAIAYDGYELRVHPHGFLVHRPHMESSSSNAHWRNAVYGKKSKSGSMYGHNSFLYKAIQREMAYGNYTPVVDPATAVCRRSLSWWRREGLW